eukprot:gene6569-2587_t
MDVNGCLCIRQWMSMDVNGCQWMSMDVYVFGTYRICTMDVYLGRTRKRKTNVIFCYNHDVAKTDLTPLKDPVSGKLEKTGTGKGGCCGHVMKPARVMFVLELIFHFNLNKSLSIIETPNATEKDLLRFHTKGYVDLLKKFTLEWTAKPERDLDETKRLHYSGLGDRNQSVPGDNPVFAGLWELCLGIAGASIWAAEYIIQQASTGERTIVINYMGGLHHAGPSFAKGFCYINDVVLAIDKLLQSFQRILYIDIDAHHGDMVEEPYIF